MGASPRDQWHPTLKDPTGNRMIKPRTQGQTMIIDKGMGLQAFHDLLETSAPYIDWIKMDSGTAALYPFHLLQQKVAVARKHDIGVVCGGTLFQAALATGNTRNFFDMLRRLQFHGMEVSASEMALASRTRLQLVRGGAANGLFVMAEHVLHNNRHWTMQKFAENLQFEARYGVTSVLIQTSSVRSEQERQEVAARIPESNNLFWVAPEQHEQLRLMEQFGPQVNLAHVAAGDALSVESMRRGLHPSTSPGLSWKRPSKRRKAN